MTTKKQDSASTTEPTSKQITKHKATRRVVQASPVAFDIIPRSQVRPSTNARPVIPSGHPEVVDTTINSTPKVQLSHQLPVDDPVSKLAPTQDERASSEAAVSPKQTGISVTDLIAKKNEAHAVKPLVPGSNDEALDQKKVAEPPIDGTVTVADAVAMAEQAGTAAAEPTLPPVESSTDGEHQPEADAANAKPAAQSNDTEPDDAGEDSVSAVLKGNDNTSKGAAPEHSEVLKGALKELDDEENGSDGRHHPDLYGGKPVIVVHKAHGSQSALMWVLWFIICLGLAVLIVNFLLDAGVIATTYNVPHTDIL